MTEHDSFHLSIHIKGRRWALWDVLRSLIEVVIWFFDQETRTMSSTFLHYLSDNSASHCWKVVNSCTSSESITVKAGARHQASHPKQSRYCRPTGLLNKCVWSDVWKYDRSTNRSIGKLFIVNCFKWTPERRCMENKTFVYKKKERTD